MSLLYSLSDYLSASSTITSLAYVLVSSLIFSLTYFVGFFIFVVGLFVGSFDGYSVGLCFGFFVSPLNSSSTCSLVYLVVAVLTILSGALAGLG